MSSVSKILQEGLAGPILDEILDPKDYDPMDILKSYFREILVVARKYARPNVEFEDLVVEGLMGLLDAIERFDPEKARGPKAFRQLAIIRIKSYMFEYFLKNRTPYTIPNYMSRAITLVERLRGLISTIQYDGDSEEVLRNFYTPEFDEAVPPYLSERIAEVKGRLLNLAEGSNKTYEAVIRGVLKVGDDIQSYENEEDFDVSPEEVAAQREYLEKFLGFLNENARDVIGLRLQGLTLEEVGREKGFTRERARQIEEETLNFFKRTRMFRDANE